MQKCQGRWTALLVFCGIILGAQLALANPFSIDIEGISEAKGIESFTFWLTVSDDFAFQDFSTGDAIDRDETSGWEIVKKELVGSVLKIDAYDKGGLFLNDPHYLKNGEMLSFTYSGTIVALELVRFGDATGTDLTEISADYRLDEKGLHFGQESGAGPHPLPEPVLTVMQEGSRVSFTWTVYDDAAGYRFYYAIPDAKGGIDPLAIGYLELSENAFTAVLPSGFSFYAAVMPNNGKGLISNIELIMIP